MFCVAAPTVFKRWRARYPVYCFFWHSRVSKFTKVEAQKLRGKLGQNITLSLSCTTCDAMKPRSGDTVYLCPPWFSMMDCITCTYEGCVFMKYASVTNGGVCGKYICSSRLSFYSEISSRFFRAERKALNLLPPKFEWPIRVLQIPCNAHRVHKTQNFGEQNFLFDYVYTFGQDARSDSPKV